MTSADLRFDLERIVPDWLSAANRLERETLAIHRARYEFAGIHARRQRVLDIACGVGYGTVMLREAGATTVTGVDISSEGIGYARQRYAAADVTFEVADTFSYQPTELLDAVVSLETIEHVAEPGRLIERFAAWLPPGGMFIGSVPITLSTDINPFHLQDFSARSFNALVRRYGFEPFAQLEQTQTITPAMIREARNSASRRDYGTGRNLPLYYLTHPGAALRRVANTVRYGFDVRYLVLACRRR